jgi:hypothetical protein
MMYAVERLSWHDIHTKFHKDWFMHSKVGGGYIDTGWRLHKLTLGKQAKNR